MSNRDGKQKSKGSYNADDGVGDNDITETLLHKKMSKYSS